MARLPVSTNLQASRTMSWITLRMRHCELQRIATDREILSLATRNDYLYAGEMQRVNGGVRIYQFQNNGLVEVGYVELQNDVWDLDFAGASLCAALANDGLAAFSLADAARPTAAWRILPPWRTHCLERCGRSSWQNVCGRGNRWAAHPGATSLGRIVHVPRRENVDSRG